MKTIRLCSSNRPAASIAAAFTKVLFMNPLFRLGSFLTMMVALLSTGPPVPRFTSRMPQAISQPSL